MNQEKKKSFYIELINKHLNRLDTKYCEIIYKIIASL